MDSEPRARTAGRAPGGPPTAVVVPARVRAPRVRWLPRERLDRLLPDLWLHRLGLVVAPAGSGKTTLLAGWAETAGVPVAWYRAESTDGSVGILLGYLEAAIRSVLPDVPAGWGSVEGAVTALEAGRGTRALLVIDDLHTLTGTAAEAALERLVDYAPPWLAVLAGTRTLPAFNLSRRRVTGELLEIGGDDLRFRSWEVERLFRDFYGEALRPDELARLARRTEGWAAGLQLFHLATRGKAPDERQRVLSRLGSSSRLMREYLARNVVEELPAELREFLVATCVLRRLSGPLCDRLLERTGSRSLLEELERRNVFTVALDDEGTFRYHEVLRSYLEGLLVEEAGEARARARAHRAGELLEAEGAVPEALAAYSRAEDWATVDRILAAQGEQLVTGPGTWIDALPPALLVQDPWLTLATARRHRAEGHWAQALDAYGRAEGLFAGAEASATCRRERLALAAWLDPHPAPTADWSGALRSAVAREALARRPAAPGGPGPAGPGDRLAAGLAALIGGRVVDARPILLGVAAEADADPTLAIAAALGASLAAVMAGDARGVVEAEAAVAAADRLGLGWLARLGRAALATGRTPAGSEYAPSDASVVRITSAREDDRWGEGLAALAEGWTLLRDGGSASDPLAIAAARFNALGAPALEAWARALEAVAISRTDAPEAREAGLAAESFARTAGTPGARLFAHLALVRADPLRADEHRALALAACDETGIHPTVALDLAPALAGETPVAGGNAGPASPIEIRCFGRFELAVGGRPVDLAALKPRPRALLRLLALNAGRPVHREVLAAAFWPEADGETAARNLHVALSALRRELEPGAERGAGSVLVREGDAYRLALPPGSRADHLALDEAIAAGRAARAHGRDAEAIAHFRAALTLYAGELLPEDGPAEWVVGRRDRARGDCVDAARALAELLLVDAPVEAASVCATGLAVDPYHDPLWRLLIDARERAGDLAAATSARSGYARMLDDLGVTRPAGLKPDRAAATAPPGTRSR